MGHDPGLAHRGHGAPDDFQVLPRGRRRPPASVGTTWRSTWSRPGQRHQAAAQALRAPCSSCRRHSPATARSATSTSHGTTSGGRSRYLSGATSSPATTTRRSMSTNHAAPIRARCRRLRGGPCRRPGSIHRLLPLGGLHPRRPPGWYCCCIGYVDAGPQLQDLATHPQ